MPTNKPTTHPMRFHHILLSLACCCAIVACEDTITTIGSSLDASSITITVDSTFTQASGQSVFTDSIIGRTTDPLLGNLSLQNYGTLGTGFLTQFMPTLNIDTAGVTAETLDSLILFLNYYNTDLLGDSLAPMVINIYRLDQTLSSPLYTNIDPNEYYNPDNLLASQAFGSSQEGYIDSSDEERPYKRISVKLPIELGREIFNEYKQNPDIFASPYSFATFFPGVYMDISYGNGRVINIKGVFMTMFYRSIDEEGESKNLEYTYMGVTPEVRSINHFTLTPDATLQQNVNDGKIYVQSPIGYMPALHFPTGEIIARYREALDATDGHKIQNILNSLSFVIPAITDATGVLDPPSYLLFIRRSQVTEFFAEKKLPDNVNSFYAAYDKDTQSYTFSNLSPYILNVMDNGGATPDDEDIILFPVQVTSETTSTYYNTTTEITSITPYCALPSIVELDIANSKITINYTSMNSI